MITTVKWSTTISNRDSVPWLPKKLGIMAIFRSQPSVANQSRATDGSRRGDHFYARLPGAAHERVATIENGRGSPLRRCLSSSGVESTFFRGGENLKVKSRASGRSSSCSNKNRLVPLPASSVFAHSFIRAKGYLALFSSPSIFHPFSFIYRSISLHSSNLTSRDIPPVWLKKYRGCFN